MSAVFYSNTRFSEKPGIGTLAAKAISVREDQTGEREIRWIEIMQQRATKEHELRSPVAELGRYLDNKSIEFACYRRATIATDISVHLVHMTVSNTKPDRTLGAAPRRNVR